MRVGTNVQVEEEAAQRDDLFLFDLPRIVWAEKKPGFLGALRRSSQMATLNDRLEQTPAGIPVSLRPFFQEYVLEDLDPEHSAFTVIERTLAWGDVPELRWLFAHYGPERLAEWVRQAGWYCLPRQRFQYWLCFFELTDYRHGERIWSH